MEDEAKGKKNKKERKKIFALMGAEEGKDEGNKDDSAEGGE